MAKAIQSEPILSIDRRQLLASTAAITAIGIVPRCEQAEAVNPAEKIGSAAEIPAWNVCAATASHIAEIAKRNRIREEAGLPLLSIPKELRRIKKAEEEAEFEAFAAVHRRAVWDEVLAPERERKGKPDWRPSSFMEGLVFQSQVNKILHEQFKVGRATTKAKEGTIIVAVS